MTEKILFLLCRNIVILKVNGEDCLLFLFLHEYCSPMMATHPHFSFFSSFIQHTSQCLFPCLLLSPLLDLIKLNEKCCDMMYLLQSPQSFLQTEVCSSHAFPLITSCGAITCVHACGFSFINGELLLCNLPDITRLSSCAVCPFQVD